MSTIVSQITSLAIVYSTVYSGADQRKHQSSASLAFVWGIHRGPVNPPHKRPVTRKMIPFDDVIMELACQLPLVSPFRSFPNHSVFVLFFLYLSYLVTTKAITIPTTGLHSIPYIVVVGNYASSDTQPQLGIVCYYKHIRHLVLWKWLWLSN